MNNWSFYSDGSAAAAATMQNPYQCPPAAQVAITTAGTNVQLYQSGITLQPNTTYQFSVAARASANRAIQVTLGRHDAPYTPYGLNTTLNLTPSWQVFTVQFTTTGFASPVSNGRLRFAMENSDVAGDFFFFDNVAIAPPGSASAVRERSAAAVDPPAPPNSRSTQKSGSPLPRSMA